jgi:hypothetical protein
MLMKANLKLVKIMTVLTMAVSFIVMPANAQSTISGCNFQQEACETTAAVNYKSCYAVVQDAYEYAMGLCALLGPLALPCEATAAAGAELGAKHCNDQYSTDICNCVIGWYGCMSLPVPKEACDGL